jgi:hypothetical protein
MGVVEFRRLSGNPSEAAQKIFDQIERLREESPLRALAAMEAWKTSPLYAAYVELFRQALVRGRSVEDLSRSGGSLTPAEAQALVNLQRHLRF